MKQVLPLLLLSAGLLVTACDTTPKDVTNPTVSLAANPTSVTGSGTVTLTATASDDIKVAKVQFYKGTTLLSEDTDAPYQASDTLSNVTDGKVTYRAVAIDTSANQAEATAQVTTVTAADTTAPSLTLSATPTTLTDSGNVKLVATASDDKGVVKVTFYRGDTRLGEVSKAPYEWTDPVTATTASQSLQYRAVAVDAAGNTTMKSVTVTVQAAPDKTAPSLTLSATPTTVTGSGTVKLTATASDNVGVTKVAFYRGTDLLGEVSKAPYEWSDPVSAGSVTSTVNYRAIAFDAAGNATEKTVSVTVQPAPDTIAPTLTLTADPTSITGSGTVTLTATTSDNVGVKKVEFYRGTELLGEVSKAPYEWSEAVSAGNTATTFTYRAVAYDAAGNTAAKSASVNVQPEIELGFPIMKVRFSKGIRTNWSDAQAIGRKVTIYHVTDPTKGSEILVQGVISSDYTIKFPDIPLDKLKLKTFDLASSSCQGNLSDTTLPFAGISEIRVDTTGLTSTPGVDNENRLLFILNADGSAPDQNQPYIEPNGIIYAARPGIVKGVFTCPTLEQTTYNVDFNVKKGWNITEMKKVPGINPGITIAWSTVPYRPLELAPIVW